MSYKLLPLILFLIVPFFRSEGAEPNRVSVVPEITDEALVNPGMGFVCFYYSNRLWAYGSQNDPGDTMDWFPGVSTIYFRLPWSYLEPEEGKYRWDIIDSYAQPWIAKGKKIAFRVTTCENRFRYATPEWVFKAGAKSTEYTFATYMAKKSAEPLLEPVYTDPIYLEKLDHFLDAMGKRYNGNPNVAFIDVGTFGLWGEGHTGGTSKLKQDQTDNVVKIHVDLHKKHFPDTLLCISDDVAGASRPGTDFPSLNYALSQGVTLRDDSILVLAAPKMWFHDKLAQKFSKTLPVIIEHEHYGLSKNRGAWDQDLLVQSVEDYRASYMSIHWWPKEYLKENKEAVDRINKRLGYRIELRSINYPKQVEVGKEFSIKTAWANVGVAPCYAGAFPAFCLKDEKGNVVWSVTDESFNVKDLPTAAPGKAPVADHETKCHFGIVTPIPEINDGVLVYVQQNGMTHLKGNVPTLKPGQYRLYVSLGKRDGSPEIAMPLKNRENDRRCCVGTIRVIE